MIRSMHRIHKISFGPHFGYKITCKGNSNITGLRIHVPYELPFSQFQEEYDKLDTEIRSQKLSEAKHIANNILQAQKEKPGYAVLGKPPTRSNNR